ncbi:S8/S53 family peptidase [Ruegeria sp. HKCCA4812]|uniref:S8/S53 family peptidase n=1 Tax=Ruegeria sp. HKCCA4812 TaxID=2682993 RepID=UPI00148879DE|nr:S8/S53 family peptidase [Ruegeria sp. HKCCA4812]
MHVRRVVLSSLFGAFVYPTVEWAQADSPISSERGKEYAIEVFSNDPPNDWARIARTLIQNDLVKIKTKPISNQGPCNTAIKELGFRSTEIRLGCSIEIERLISDLSSGRLAAVDIPKGHVAYPDLPIQSIGAVQVYDKSNSLETFRCTRVKTPWGLLATSHCTSTTEPTGYIELNGFEISASVPDTEESRQIVKSLRRFNPVIGRNEIEVFELDEVQSYGGLDSLDGESWLDSCLIEKPSYSKFLGLEEMPTCDCRDNCSKIVLFDRAPAMHPAIAHKVDESYQHGQPNLQCLSVGEIENDIHHASHLAGILISRNDPEYFTGVSPSSHLIWKDAKSGKPFIDIRKVAATNRAIRDFSVYAKMKVVLFASSWKYDDDDEKEKLKQDSNFRLNNPPYVQTIRWGNNIWVVAAGNNSNGGINISAQSDRSPANIGDRKNILVVAACENCGSRNAKLSNYSNFSDDGLVHVAAYGGKIPAPATETEYGIAQGTSQASALVAGLISSMSCVWPNYHWTPRESKVRIQAAVFPPINEGLRNGLATGVVDAKKALLDPTSHHVAVRGKRVRPAKLLQWCVDKISPESPLIEGQDADGGAVTPRLLRHFVGYDTTDGDREYFLFHEPSSQELQSFGTVRRTGPGVIGSDPLVKVTFSDGKEPSVMVLKANEIEFILTPPRLEDSAKIETDTSACN